MRRACLLGLIVFGALAACDDDGGGSQDALQICVDEELTTFNPLLGSAGPVDQMVGRLLHRGVASVAPDQSLVAGVVTAVPTVSNGGVTVDGDTITVRVEIVPGATWADGTPITGDDFAFTLALLQANDNRHDPLYDEITSSSAETGAFEWTMSRHVGFDQLFPFLAPKHAVEGADFVRDFNAAPWVASGPYELAEPWVAGEPLQLERNPRFVGAPPAIERVVVRFLDDPSAALTGFEDGTCDLYASFWDGMLAEQLRQAGVTVEEAPLFGAEIVFFQFGDGRLDRNADSLLADRRLRRAIAHALDPSAIAQAVTGEPSHGLAGFGSVFGEPIASPWDRYDHDVDAAKALVSELCDDLGRDCVATPPVVKLTSTPNRAPTFEAMKTQLAAVGITADIETEPPNVFFGDTFFAGTYELAAVTAVNSPGRYGLMQFLEGFEPAPIHGWDGVSEDDNDTVFRDLMAEVRGAVVPSDFRAAAEVALTLLADDVVTLPLFIRTDLIATRPGRIEGLVPATNLQGGSVSGIEGWRLVD